MIKDVHDQRVLLQTVAQPHKLTVTPPDAGNLLPKTHAICLESRAGEKPNSQYKANIIPNVKRHMNVLNQLTIAFHSVIL